MGGLQPAGILLGLREGIFKKRNAQKSRVGSFLAKSRLLAPSKVAEDLFVSIRLFHKARTGVD